MDFLSSNTQQILQKALDGLSLRHQAISSNIANVETPGYNKLVVDFESQLTQALQGTQGQTDASQLKQTNPLHMDAEGHTVANTPQSSLERLQFNYRQDNNGVDVESEMVSLAKNTERYMAVSKLQKSEFDSLNRVIQSQGG